MKRIDDKIKEIEKKDKTNRILFVAFVVLIAAFMVYAISSEKKISDLKIKQSDTYKELEAEKVKKEETLKKLEATYIELKAEKDKTEKALKELEATYKKLEAEKDKTEKALSDLEKSLRPEEYWNHIESQDSVEDYIDYITNDFGIEKPIEYMSKALEKIHSPDVQGYKGWLFVGSIKNDGIYNSKNIIEVIYRKDADGDIKTSKPQAGDVVKLKTKANRITYKNKNLSKKNPLGWRNKTKAFVTEVWKNPKSTDFRILVKYY